MIKKFTLFVLLCSASQLLARNLPEGLAARIDSDTDALTNMEEKRIGTDPLKWDTDGDKVPDDQEALQGSDPLGSADRDRDGLPDDWERWIAFAAGQKAGQAPNPDKVLGFVRPQDDYDGDGLSNKKEFELGTSPVVARQTIILFLSEDQSPHLGCLGTVGLDTPNLDRFGAGGVVFERAFSLSPVCSPSKMAMYTGTYSHMNSAWRNVENYGTEFPLPGGRDPSKLHFGGVHEDLPTLIEILNDRGYFTAVSHKSHVQPVRKFPYRKGYGQPESPARAEEFVRDALQEAGDRPLFFLFGIGAPHLPFRGILKDNGLWSDSGGLAGDGHAKNVDAKAIAVPDCYPDVPGVRQDMADYYGAIECVDAVFGGVLAALEAAGERENALILFTSDHGIGLHRAKQSIYGLHVPLLVGGAGVAGGARITAPVSHLDLVPTLLDYAGIQQMPSMFGKSLRPVLAGKQTGFPDRKTVLAASHHFQDSRAVCDGRYYYIRNIRKPEGADLDSLDGVKEVLNTDQWQEGAPWYNRAFEATRAATGTPQRELLRQLVEGDVPEEELYDLSADLWMTNNLVDHPEKATVLDALRSELAEWRQRTEDCDNSPAQLQRREKRMAD